MEPDQNQDKADVSLNGPTLSHKKTIIPSDTIHEELRKQAADTTANENGTDKNDKLPITHDSFSDVPARPGQSSSVRGAEAHETMRKVDRKLISYEMTQLPLGIYVIGYGSMILSDFKALLALTTAQFIGGVVGSALAALLLLRFKFALVLTIVFAIAAFGVNAETVLSMHHLRALEDDRYSQALQVEYRDAANDPVISENESSDLQFLKQQHNGNLNELHWINVLSGTVAVAYAAETLYLLRPSVRAVYGA